MIQTQSQHSDAPRPLPAEQRILSRRVALTLGFTALLQGLLAAWALAGADSWLPLSGLVPLVWLPQTLSGMALGLSVLSTPFLFEQTAQPRLARILFAALWQAVVLGFLLLVCARLVPLQSGAILRALLTFWLCVLLLLTLALCAARAYAGVVFVWFVALPVLLYFLAEVYLWSSGAQDWSPGSTESLYQVVHWGLNFSPGTALLGALNGTLADGSEYNHWPFVLGMMALLVALWLCTAHTRARRAAAGS